MQGLCRCIRDSRTFLPICLAKKEVPYPKGVGFGYSFANISAGFETLIMNDFVALLVGAECSCRHDRSAFATEGVVRKLDAQTLCKSGF